MGEVRLNVSTCCLLADTLPVKHSVGEQPVTSTAVGLVETGLKLCPETPVNCGVSGLWLPLLQQNVPPELLDLGCLCLGQVLQLCALGDSDGSVHPVYSSYGLTVLRTILSCGAGATWPGLPLSRTRVLTLSVTSTSPWTLTKRPTRSRTDVLGLILLLGRPVCWLTYLKRRRTTGGLLLGNSGDHGGTLGFFLSAGLLRRRLNNLLPLSLVATHGGSQQCR